MQDEVLLLKVPEIVVYNTNHFSKWNMVWKLQAFTDTW